jgi:hypothetical protein
MLCLYGQQGKQDHEYEPIGQDCCKKFATKRKTVVHTLRHRPIQAFLFSLFLAVLGGSHFL